MELLLDPYGDKRNIIALRLRAAKTVDNLIQFIADHLSGTLPVHADRLLQTLESEKFVRLISLVRHPIRVGQNHALALQDHALFVESGIVEQAQRIGLLPHDNVSYADSLNDYAYYMWEYGKDVPGATAALPRTFSAIDRAAKFGIIKDNTAARYKSKMASRVKALASA